MVRLKHLYAYGYDIYSITSILKEEFQDIEVNEVSAPLIERLIKSNKEMLDAYKEELADKCTEIQQRDVQALFKKATEADSKAADALIKKLLDLLDQVANLDMSDPEDVKQYNGYLNLIERTQNLYAKIAGTDAFREFTTYKMKLELAHSLKNGGMIIPINGGGGDGMPKITG